MSIVQDWTTQDLGEIVLGKRKFQGELVTYADGNQNISLIGARGAYYFLREILNAPGYYHVVSFKSGELKGSDYRPIVVFMVGQVISLVKGVSK